MATTREWLSGIYEISKVINTTLELGEILRVIERETRKVVDFDRLVVAVLEEGGQRLRLYTPERDGSQAGNPPPEPHYATTASIGLDEHPLGHIVRTREPLIVADVHQDERFGAADDPVGQGTVSCALLPLVSGDRALGALAFTRARPQPFTDTEVEMLLNVAEQTALAVEHAHLYAAEKKRSNHLAVINEVAKRALATFDLDTLISQTAALIQEHFAYYDVSIFMVDHDNDEVVLKAQAGAYNDVSAIGYRQPLGVGMVGWAAKTGKTLLANDVTRDPHYIVAFEGERASRSELCVPIKIGGEVVGIINVECTEVGAFDQIDVMALETLSDQVAQAIENARLYDEMRYLKELDESILASIPSSILVLDRNLVVVSVNEMCCRVLERAREEIIGERFEKFLQFEPLDSAALRRAIEHVIDADQRASFTAISVRLPNGRERIADVYLSPVARRTQRRALVYINDITDRRRAEEELLREKQKLDDIVSAMGAGLLLLDRDANIAWSNRAMDEWFGGGHSLVGKKCYTACRGRDDRCPDCAALLVFQTGQVQTYTQVAMVEHQARHFQNILAPIRDESGTPIQVIRLTFDVTDHATAVERLALLHKLSEAMEGMLELDRLLHLILTCVTAGPGLGFNRAILLMVSDDGAYLEGRLGVGPSSHEEAARIWSELSRRAQTLEDLLALFDKPHTPGDSSMQYVAQQIRIPMTATDQAPVRAVLEKRPIVVHDAANDPSVTPELRSLLGTDHFVCVPLIARDVSLGAIIADNMFTGRRIEATDVEMLKTFASHAGLAISSASAYKRLEEKLNELEETQDRLVRSERLATVGRLAAHVAHEIRNPLTTIGGFARAMLRNPHDATKVERNTRIIIEEVERLERILADVMNFSKPGKPILRERDINETIQAICAFHENEFANNNITLRVSLDPDCPKLRFDPEQIRQVLINLFKNAIEAMPEGGELTVMTRALEDRVEVAVADTGHGMSDNILDNLFQPFFTTKLGGTGLGLSVSQKIIHDHGGDIMVRSRPGAGSSFTFWLPIPADSQSE